MIIVTQQKEDISEKLKFIDSLNVSQKEKDALKKYVQLMNQMITFTSDDGEVEGIINP